MSMMSQNKHIFSFKKCKENAWAHARQYRSVKFLLNLFSKHQNGGEAHLNSTNLPNTYIFCNLGRLKYESVYLRIKSWAELCRLSSLLHLHHCTSCTYPSTSPAPSRVYLAAGLVRRVFTHLPRILLTQPWLTRSCLEMSQGRTPWWASSTIRCLTTSGRGLPFTNTPPSWFTPPCPTWDTTAAHAGA